ncbi:class I SAM-dependent DNA methyltransferase [Pseudanabaena sp. UWO310]|uniref:HsdM family class I SAM-dependent methyltransferase n=1 Tax=Pseudanabaena sp. UWO310 TaxID=2480795 RepID=UPI00115861E1|nr:N-6 DNA methylase [Pseudanabaena sp. UWO310]TYQ25789.1 N-6 DNA methylase [Pseudanabaena sp. UWO310]
MNLDQLLDQLGYTQSQNYRSTHESSQEPLTEHLFRAAKKAGVQGAYFFQTSPPEQKILPPRPAVYVAEAKTREEAREIHKRLWNLGNTPFLVILLPNEIRVYTGFDFSQRNEKKGLVYEIQDIAKLTFENIREKLVDFGSNSIDSGKIWQTQSKHITPENRVDIHLLNNLEKLEEHLESRGVDLSIIHALIGKYVYIRYLYDRKILSREWLAENNINLDTILGRNATLEGLLKLTELLENRFNGAIFPLPSNVEEILGNDEIVALVASSFKGDDLESGQMHLDFNAYDFSYIPVETLSSIYEQFLNSQGTGKKVGAVYTPEPVADYLLCELQESKPLQKGMRILDPCCGSGIFLVLAYRRLIELEVAQRQKNPPKPEDLSKILANIYGVERNREACYVAEFSLILTLLSYINPPDLQHNKEFKFPLLHNIQIFECDFFDDESDFWQQDKKFDWIVGNPPWIEIKPSLKDEEFASSWIRRNIKERHVAGNRVCEAFSWRVVDLLTLNGCVGLLIHAKSLFNHESEKYRKQFFTQQEILRVTNFSNLAYVLFGGRGEAPAATIIYRKAIPNVHKSQIIHYAPFVANQVSNRPWKQDKKNTTWIITINSNEIQSIDPEDIENGDVAPWKLALWGNYRDSKAIQRIKSLFKGNLFELTQSYGWNFNVGIQLKDISVLGELRTKEVEPVPYLGGKQYFDVDSMNKAKHKFSIPENVLKPIPNEKLFIRKRGGKVGLGIINAPHIILNPNYFVYGEDDFVIPDPHLGISANKQDEDYLRALSVFLSSSIIKYYLFFQSPSWGVDRNRIYFKDVKNIPVCDFSLEQIKSLSNLQRELEIAELSGEKLTSSLQNYLDEKIQEILRIPKNLSILVSDFSNIRLKLNKGKVVVSATAQPQEHELLRYGSCLRDELDSFTEGSGLRHKVSLTYSKNLIVCSVEFVRSDTITSLDVIVEKAQGDISLFLNYIQEKAKQRFSQWVYVQRSLRIYDDSRVYICKSSRLIDWTRTQALNDSDDIIAEILTAKRGLHEDVQ